MFHACMEHTGFTTKPVLYFHSQITSQQRGLLPEQQPVALRRIAFTILWQASLLTQPAGA